MHRLLTFLSAKQPRKFAGLLCLLFLCAPGRAAAQRHSLGSSPPTAPPAPAAKTAPIVRAQPAPPTGPITGVSSGMGPIQFQPASLSVPAPQALTRQLSAGDERTRSGALTSLGAPGQYLTHGHVPFPHSVQVDFIQLGLSDALDALLTVELDEHIVSAVLVPEGDSWHRVATLTFATGFGNTGTTPASFVRPLRSWLQPDRYRAVYRATVSNPDGDFTESEADLRVVNNHAVVVLDFVSGARQCDHTGQLRPPHQTCELLQRWLEPDPSDPTHHFTLISGTGHFSAHEANDPLSHSRNYRLTRLRSFTCQPLIFAESSMRFEPTANASPCGTREAPVHTEIPRAEGAHPETPHPEAGRTETPHPEPGHPEAAHPDAPRDDPAHTDPPRPQPR